MKKRDLYNKLVTEAVMALDSDKIVDMRKATGWTWVNDPDPSRYETDVTKAQFLRWCLKGPESWDSKANWSLTQNYSAGFWLAIQDCNDKNSPNGTWMRVMVGWGPTEGNDDGEAYD